MKKFKKISVLLLAMIMTMSMAIHGFAAEEDNTVNTVGTGSAIITTKFVMAEGLTVPGGETGVTFRYTITPTTADAPNTADPKIPSIDAVTFTDDDRTEKNLSDGLYTLSKTAKINFGTYTHAGVYDYTVERTPEEVTNVGHCGSKYHLRVWVENDNGGLKIASITAVKLKEDGDDTDEKLKEITFTHTYRNTGFLTITKNTVSTKDTPDVADKTKKFKFGLNFTKSPTLETAMTDISGTIQDKNKNWLDLDGNIVDEVNKNQTFVVGTDSTIFYLKDGDTVTFKDVPVGTTYKAVEPAAADGYAPTINLWENGVQTLTDKTFADNENASASVVGKQFALVGEGTNKVEFTNTYDAKPLTGIIMNNLPFILLVALGICALGVLAVSGKRRKANR